ncbi:aminodeoxychorismate/anthranilate synthase component II [Rheinheimera tangshanensis]|jgi:anthranilate synthase component 2|uniref:anthranilate synthase n=1 Tax=Rheinheimera tangshanensis TaxID=400153 RepID=A0A5C8LYM5_9GAMM|nr:aminodeoxychorismate/anthranilate synthase component II [Rheinheimera tangshanensis]TXK80572.1 aminodeoxychorismate/anthranilate synthase component II [Rheinheimera tangshanensis]GGM60205.1 glutamine amidotransferase [Rheinheimera tangshanensis]
MSVVYLLDNLDSFSYNLVDEVAQLGFSLKLYRNTVPAAYIFEKMQQEQQPVVLLLSPGPGAPSQAGSMPELISLCAGKFPMLGICLGHQALVEHYGGVVGRAGETVHGKTSIITLNDHPVFGALPKQFPVARYHSLMATEVPNSLQVIAAYQHIPMAIVHEEHKALGYQFHPESILTTLGKPLLKQSLDYLMKNQGAIA